MDYFFGMIFLILVSSGCNNKTVSSVIPVTLPNGIYLLSEKADTGIVKVFYHTVSDSLHGNDSLSVTVFSTPDISDKNFSSVFIRKDSTQNLVFTLNEQGLKKIHILQTENKDRKIAFIINGEVVAISDLSQPPNGLDHIDLSPLANRDSLRKWSEKISGEFHKRDSIAAIRPRDGAFKTYDESGKIMREEFYRNDSLIRSTDYYESGKIRGEEEYANGERKWTKNYYENGVLSYSFISIDTIVNSEKIESYEKIFFQNGVMSEEYYGSRIYPVLYKTYYESGTLKYESIGQIGAYTGPDFTRSYGENGNLEKEEHSTYLDQLTTGDEGEFNHPRVYREKNYENKKVISEVEFYSNCGECDIDSTGVWKYYENGKLTSTKKFPSWQSCYKKAGGKL